MGISDKTTFTLGCPQCDTTEAKPVLDYGSTYSGPKWDSQAKFSKFETVWTGGGHEEPKITSATCRACGEQATVTSAYGPL